MTEITTTERMAEFVKRGEDDEPGTWVPMWISRSVAIRVLGATDDDEWTHDDDLLNQIFHEWLESSKPKPAA
jgi:hypothetical protein